MRYHDPDDLTDLNAQPWQLELLKANPGYCSWGPHEDYMIVKGKGWNSPKTFTTWSDFGPWKLDDLNECVGFYFDVSRASTECPTCSGDGYHTLARPVSDAFYDFENRGNRWADAITQDECDALIEHGRAPVGSTAEQMNAENRPGSRKLGHDAINRFTLIEARLKRMGLPKDCPECSGSGYVYTAPSAHASLVLWWLHPRKGCSRGIEVLNVEQADLPAVQQFLRTAAARNAERFAGSALIA